MNISDILIFELVVASGSFTKAAQRGYLTPPAIRSRINELESELNVTLFNRTSTGVTLTVPGQVLHAHAQQLIDESQQLTNQVRQSAKDRKLTIRIGSSLLNPASQLISVWNQVLQKNPNYRLQFIPLETINRAFPDLYRHLGDEVDILFCPYSHADTMQQTSFYQMGAYHFTITMHLGDPLAQKKEISIDDLAGKQITMIPRGKSKQIDQLYQAFDQAGNHVQTIDTDEHYSIDTFNQFIVSQTPYLLTLERWHDVLPGLTARPLAVPYTMPYGIVSPRKATPEIQHFIAQLQETIGKAN